ncbi:hypothetical protein ACJJIE_09950 [Microbulbifer sp. TRSA001]|uniref:hypothetical protein n=1 Tax=Microbulbifer sp. TRSA001 TaxID=3243381 RepID=UPI00403A236D
MKIFSIVSVALTISAALIFAMPDYFRVEEYLDNILGYYFFIEAVLTTYIAVGVFNYSADDG